MIDPLPEPKLCALWRGPGVDFRPILDAFVAFNLRVWDFMQCTQSRWQPTARGRHLEDKHIAVGGELHRRDRQWSLSLPKRDGPLDIEAERAKRLLSMPPQ